mgnify:CR=1 FL=1
MVTLAAALQKTNINPHLLHILLHLSLLLSSSNSVDVTESEAASPLNTYFSKDNEGLTIFDYAALGKTPDEKPSPLKIEFIGTPIWFHQ